MIFARCLAYLTVVKLSLQFRAPLERPIFQLSVLCHEIPAIGGQTPLQIQSLLQDGRYLFSVCFLTLTFSDRKNYL